MLSSFLSTTSNDLKQIEYNVHSTKTCLEYLTRQYNFYEQV